MFIFFWVMSVLLSLARGIKDARQAQAFFQPVGQNHVVHRPLFRFSFFFKHTVLAFAIIIFIAKIS
jgi:hypothetical protein